MNTYIFSIKSEPGRRTKVLKNERKSLNKYKKKDNYTIFYTRH